MSSKEDLIKRKIALFNEFNIIVKRQIDFANTENIDEIDRLTICSNKVINKINIIDDELVNIGDKVNISEKLNNELKEIVSEVKANYDILIDKIDFQRNSAKDKLANVRKSRKTVKQYKAYTTKTSLGFNTLK